MRGLFRFVGGIVLIMLLINYFGSDSDGPGETPVSEARELGFRDRDQMLEAREAGFATGKEWRQHKLALSQAAAAERADEIEAKRQALIEKMAQESEAGQAEQNAKWAQIRREMGQGGPGDPNACHNDLQCWGDKHAIRAGIHCARAVERLAKYSFEWTDGWIEPKFSHFRWADKAAGHVTYLGDRIKFQNGFGAMQYHVYSCDFDPGAEAVLAVDAVPGRL